MTERSKENVLLDLKTTRLFRVLAEDELVRISGHCRLESYQAGHTLCRKEEILQKLYIVLKGCVRGVIGPPERERTWGFFNSGDVFGQYGLLSGQPSVAELSCEFDTTVLTIERDGFLKLITEIPNLEIALRRKFHERFRSAFSEEKIPRYARSVVFVRSPDRSAQTDIPQQVADELARRGEEVAFLSDRPASSNLINHFPIETGRTLATMFSHLDADRADRLVFDMAFEESSLFFELLTRANEIFWCYDADDAAVSNKLLDLVLAKSERATQKIKRVCLLQPDQLNAPQGLIDNRLEKRDFIMPISPTSSSDRWYRKGIARVRNHLCDVRIGISLAGGGARGLVHFGVLRALDRAGVSFDLMSGTSAGAMFGLSYASGLEIDYMLEEYRKKLTPNFPFKYLPNGDRWFLVWKYRTRSWDKMLRAYFDCNFEQLQIPFASVAVDMVGGREVVREAGDIIEAMLESLNLPFVANPILKDGMALVDGGILNNLPADVLVDRGADYVVGVDVSAGMTKQFGKNIPGMKTSEMRRIGSLETLFRVLE